MTKPVAETEMCCATVTRTASTVTFTKADNPHREKITATPLKDSHLEGGLDAEGIITGDNNLTHCVIATEHGQTDDDSDTVLILPEIIEKRMQLSEIYRTKLQEKYDLYKEYLTELFFLRNGGNFMHYVQFKKKPSAKLLEYLKSKLPDTTTGQEVARKTSNESTNSHSDPKSPASDGLSNTYSKKPSSEIRGPRGRSVSNEGVTVKSKQREKSPNPKDQRFVRHDC